MSREATRIAIIAAELSTVAPRLTARFEPSTDPESEDDQFTIIRDGAEFSRAYDPAEFGFDRAEYAIQCCLIGGGYSADEYCYSGDELKQVCHLYSGRSLKHAAAAIVRRLRGDSKLSPYKPRPETKRSGPDPLQQGMIAAAEKVTVAERFEFDTSNPPKVTLLDRETGATHEMGLCDYAGVRRALAALFGENRPEPLRETLRQLREECRDWQHALSGERPSLDEICSQADELLNGGNGAR